MVTWFAHEYCTDVAATQRFYGELIGLEQIWGEQDDVAFVHDCVQLSFHRVDSLERSSGWAFQPGWGHGQLPDAPELSFSRSISIALEPEKFAAAVERLKTAGVAALRSDPFWVGYWSFVVQDPDGTTVELADGMSPE